VSEAWVVNASPLILFSRIAHLDLIERLAPTMRLWVTQPKVSALRHYKLAGFSVERLMNLLTALDQDVEIVIRRKPRSRKVARISVVAAYELQMTLKPKATPRQRRSFTSARRRALARLGKGLDLQWSPPGLGGTRFTTEAEGRGDVTGESRNS
jgi:hypothetical protein